MVNHTKGAAMQRLIAKEWDVAILYVKGKNPIALDKDTKFSMEEVGESQVLTLESVVGHPAPQSQADVHKQFDMYTYVELSEVYAMDFLKEKHLLTGPVISRK